MFNHMGIRLAVGALFVLSAMTFAAPAQAEHVCYTPGDVQVCTFIPGDEVVDDLLNGPTSFSCLTPGDFQFCVEVPGGSTVDDLLNGPSSLTCLTPGDFQFCIEPLP